MLLYVVCSYLHFDRSVYIKRGCGNTASHNPHDKQVQQGRMFLLNDEPSFHQNDGKGSIEKYFYI
jgi:hypothetical protein